MCRVFQPPIPTFAYISAWSYPKHRRIWHVRAPFRQTCLRRLATNDGWQCHPQTPNSTKISQEVNVHYFAPSGKRSTSTTSAHNPTRKPPSPPIKRTTSTTSTRNPGEGRGKEIYEHYFALNPSPSHPILRLDRPTGPEPSSFAPHPPLGSPDRPGASQFAPLNSLCIVIGATRPP